MARQGPRDTTRAIVLVALIKREADGLFSGAKGEQLDKDFTELENILQTMDARTGRRDPSKRAKK